MEEILSGYKDDGETAGNVYHEINSLKIADNKSHSECIEIILSVFLKTIEINEEDPMETLE